MPNKPRINTKTRRHQLVPRGFPYWTPVAKGKAIGFHRTPTGGSWRARIRTPQGQKHTALREGINEEILDIDSDFEELVKPAAEQWFEQVIAVKRTSYTVKECVADYIAHLKVDKGESAAKDAKQRLEKHLIPALGKVELFKITVHQVKQWRNGLVRVSDNAEDVRRSKDSANRVLSQAKAAFNLAYRDRRIASDRAWRPVTAFRDVGEARKLFLTDEQVKRLLKHADGAIYNLARAAVVTGARYGELINAKVHDLDLINGTLHLNGKTGPRDCYLSDDAVKFFRDIAKDRLPNAHLLVRDNGEPWSKSHQHRPMKELVKKAKLPAATVFYSLRHYHISKALLAGIPAQVIAENTGTSIRMIEKHYGKFLATDRRRMLNQVVLT